MYLTVFLWGIGNSLITLFSKESCSRQTARVTKVPRMLPFSAIFRQGLCDSCISRATSLGIASFAERVGVPAWSEGPAWRPGSVTPMSLQWGLVGAAWFDDHTHQRCHVLAVTLGNSPTRFDISFSFVVWGSHHHGVVARNAFDNPRIAPTSGMTNMFQLVWTPMAWSTMLRILVTMYLESRKARWIGVMTGIGADGLGESVLSFPFPFHTSRVLKRTLCYET